jgi:hypothetical protein
MKATSIQTLILAVITGIAFVLGVTFANGSPIESISLIKKEGISALFQSKKSFASSVCSIPNEKQDEIFFLSCGGIF